MEEHAKDGSGRRRLRDYLKCQSPVATDDVVVPRRREASVVDGDHSKVSLINHGSDVSANRSYRVRSKRVPLSICSSNTSAVDGRRIPTSPSHRVDGDVGAKRNQVVRLNQSLSSPSADHAFRVVVMKVSLHCQGCAGKVERHLSRMEGVTSFDINMDTKMVTVMGHVSPSGVLQSVSKVKRAVLWMDY